MCNLYKLNMVRVFIFLSILMPAYLSAQDRKITGKIVSKSFNALLEDVEIYSPEGVLLSKSNSNGEFELSDSVKEVLIKKEGYLPERIALGASGDVLVLMKEDFLGGNKSFKTLYGAPQSRKLSTGSVTEIYSNQLGISNSRSTAGLLVGYVPGLYANQASAMPTGDAVSLSLRGGNPLVLLDGVPQSFAAINPEQIESITLMKDAISTSMLGMRSADGVLYIKTKSNDFNEKQKVSLRVQSGAYQPLAHIKPLDAFNFATLYNEARQNDGLSAQYSASALQAYKYGSDPYYYADVNWYDQVMKNQSSFNRYDVALSGGGKVANYFVNLDYFAQEGLLKNNNETTYNTRLGLKRYSFRSNTNINVSKRLIAGLNVGGQFQNTNQPGSAASTLLSNMLTTPSLAYPVFNPDGSLGGTSNYTNNIYGQNFLTGYRVANQLEYKVDINLKADLSDITSGLWAKATGSYYNYMLENIARVKTFEVYQMSVSALGDTIYDRRGNVKTPMTNTGGVSSRSSGMYGEFTVGYDKRFGQHGVSAILNTSIDRSTDNSLLPENYKGIAGRVFYDFEQKYLVNLAVGYNGVERFAEDNRYGFFPAVGLGWNIAEEDFFKSVSWLDDFKLRGSYGLTGAVTAGRYTYLGYYSSSGSYSFGTTAGAALTGVTDKSFNPNVTWEKAKKLNAGVDLGFFRRKLSITIDYFDNHFYDILQTPNSLTAIYGNTYPLMNIGKIDRKGIEFQATYQNSLEGFKYFFQPSYSNFKSINSYYDEPARMYDWQIRTGKLVGSTYGYIADGLFQSQTEADAAPKMAGYTPQAGDIRYHDLNNDGVINSDDQTTIGTQKPITMLGLSLGFTYKEFDFSALIQGVLNREVLWTGNTVWEFQNNGLYNAFEHHLGRWNPDNKENATYPRLSIGNNINNNVTSTYWLRNGDYFRLKNVEIGYTLPHKVSMRIGLPTVRVFFNGSNLFTWSKDDLIDPEAYSSPYPMTRIVSGGLNVKF